MIAALFVRPDSVYKQLPHVDCYDMHTPEREATPPAFAQWLVDLARSCA